MWWNMFYFTGTGTPGTGGPCAPTIEGDVYITQDIALELEPEQALDISLDFSTVELSVDIEIEEI